MTKEARDSCHMNSIRSLEGLCLKNSSKLKVAFMSAGFPSSTCSKWHLRTMMFEYCPLWVGITDTYSSTSACFVLSCWANWTFKSTNYRLMDKGKGMHCHSPGANTNAAEYGISMLLYLTHSPLCMCVDICQSHCVTLKKCALPVFHCKITIR